MSERISWYILNLDLSQELPHLKPRENEAGFYLILWWHQIPLGQLNIPFEQLPISPAQLLQQILVKIAPNILTQFKVHHLPESKFEPYLCQPRQHLKSLQRYLNQSSTLLNISVIVCTRDRPEILTRCLQSLLLLSPSPYEIIVVDNSPSTPETAQVVEQFPTVNYILENQSGLSYARNTGISHATGTIVAFTDDDVMVKSNWIERLCFSFKRPEVMAVTGLILPIELETEAQVLFEQEHGWGNYKPTLFDSSFFAQTYQYGAPVWKIGAGANMAFRKIVFEQLGNFDQRLGAGASGCSEDSEIWYRILAAGGACLYDPTVVVEHRHRRNLPELKSQLYQYMKGHVVALLIQFFRYHHWGNLYRLFFGLPRHYLGTLCMGLLKGFNGKYQTTPWEVIGSLDGIRYFIRYWKSPASSPTKFQPEFSETNDFLE